MKTTKCKVENFKTIIIIIVVVIVIVKVVICKTRATIIVNLKIMPQIKADKHDIDNDSVNKFMTIATMTKIAIIILVIVVVVVVVMVIAVTTTIVILLLLLQL